MYRRASLTSTFSGFSPLTISAVPSTQQCTPPLLRGYGWPPGSAPPLRPAHGLPVGSGFPRLPAPRGQAQTSALIALDRPQALQMITAKEPRRLLEAALGKLAIIHVDMRVDAHCRVPAQHTEVGGLQPPFFWSELLDNFQCFSTNFFAPSRSVLPVVLAVLKSLHGGLAATI